MKCPSYSLCKEVNGIGSCVVLKFAQHSLRQFVVQMERFMITSAK